MQHRETIYGRILVPLGSELALEVAPFALGLARAAHGELLLLHVEPDAEGSDPGAVPHPGGSLEAQARTMGIPARRLLRRGPLGPTIRAVAEAMSADLVILSRRPDSTALPEILRELERPSPEAAPCPVMVVPTFASRPSPRPPPPMDPVPDPGDWRFGCD